MQLEADPRLSSRWWDDVDRLFAALPPSLFRQIKLLEYDLALRYSRTGQFHDIFSSPDQPPVLSIAPWLLSDLEIPSSATRDEAEKRLFVASVLMVTRVQTIEGLHDPGGFTTADRIALVQWLSERAAAEIARVVPRDSSYWDAYEAIAGEDANRLAASANPDFVAGAGDDPEAHLASPFSAPLRLVALAALAVVGRPEVGPRVAEMLDHMAQAYQVMAGLASLQRDLELGRLSYPIAFIARTARIPVRPAPRPCKFSTPGRGSCRRGRRSSWERWWSPGHCVPSWNRRSLASARRGSSQASFAFQLLPRFCPTRKPISRRSWRAGRLGSLATDPCGQRRR